MLSIQNNKNHHPNHEEAKSAMRRLKKQSKQTITDKPIKYNRKGRHELIYQLILKMKGQNDVD